MAHYLIVYRPPRETFVDDATAEESSVIGRHFDYLKQLLSERRLVMAGRTEDGQLGIAVITADDESKARAVMHSDPAVAEGIFSGELMPFRLALSQSE